MKENLFSQPDTAFTPPIETPACAVFVRQGALGDFILSLPLLDLLAGNSSSYITVIAKSAFRMLIPDYIRYDAFVDIEVPIVQELFGLHGNGVASYSTIPTHCPLYLFGTPDDKLSESLRSRYGYTVYFIPPRPEGPLHASDAFIRHAGFSRPETSRHKPLWDKQRVCNIKGGVLWVHPGSGSKRKNYPPYLFVDSARTWSVKTGRMVVFSFGEADHELYRIMYPELEGATWVQAVHTKLTASELKEKLLATAGIYLGNDSGVSHLAGALGIPTVTLFKSTDPRIWRPLGYGVVLEADTVSPIAADTILQKLLKLEKQTVARI